MAKMRTLTARDIVAPIVVPVKAAVGTAVLASDILDAVWKRSGDISYVAGETAKTAVDTAVVGAGVLVGAVQSAAEALDIDLSMSGEDAVKRGKKFFSKLKTEEKSSK